MSSTSIPWSSRTRRILKNLVPEFTQIDQNVFPTETSTTKTAEITEVRSEDPKNCALPEFPQNNLNVSEVQNSTLKAPDITEEKNEDTKRCVIPSLSLICEQVLEQTRFTLEPAVNAMEDVDNFEEHLKENTDERSLHVTAEIEENLHTTPEREFSDFDSDDDVADPSYSYREESREESDDELGEGEEQCRRLTRKRKADPKMWKKNVTKKERHSGLEYKTDSGSRMMKPRTLKEPCGNTCKLLCRNRISQERRQIMHRNFWSPSKTIDIRRQYVASCVTQMPVKRRREKTGERHKKRNFTNSYSFETGGVKETVCKTFFLSTLCISQQTVDTAIKKKKDGGIVTPDKRGKHVPVNKISEEVRNSVRNHILKFPTYESHYSRERSKKKYLGNHLNISRMYNLYLEHCKESDFGSEAIAKEWLYAEIFNYEYNYSFKNPDNDTCDLCDQLQLQIRESESLESRKSVQTEYDEHLADTNNRYKIKSEDKKKSKDNLLEKKVVMIDLQKCLPTPDLHNSQSFYSLKLWTYNLTIQDATLEKSFCMMWDESLAGRGGNEVASCLVKWVLDHVSHDVKEITIWSDNCPSQNRNILMVMLYFLILRIKPNVNVVNHKYLARGHTHLEADAVHSVIERERKKVPQFEIMTPWDWQQMIRLCGTKKQMTVVNMDIPDFKNFKELFEGSAAPYINKKKNSDGKDFLISQAVYMQVRKSNPGILYYKTDFGDDFLEVDFNRKTRRNDCIPISLSPIREKPKPISVKKYNHLQKLLKWVPRRFHDYYKNLEYGGDEDE